MWENTVRFRLEDGEYEEFVQWFRQTFLKKRKAGSAAPDFSNLKADTQIRLDAEGFGMQTDGFSIQAGLKDLWLRYSAVTDLDETEHLVVFFAQKEFWAVPKRALGDTPNGQGWLAFFKKRCEDRASGRTDFETLKERCNGPHTVFYCYTRTVDQVLDAYVDLGKEKKELQEQRKLSIFPYRYVGVQALALEQDGILEYGERSVARHLYDDLDRVVYTWDFLCLIKKDGEEILLPAECLADDPANDPAEYLADDPANDPANDSAEDPADGPEYALSDKTAGRELARLVSACNQRRGPGSSPLVLQPLHAPGAMKRYKQRLKEEEARKKENLIVLSNHRRHRKQKDRKTKKKPDFRRYGNPVSGYVLIGAAALITIGIGVFGPEITGNLREETRQKLIRGTVRMLSGPEYAQMLDEAAAEAESFRQETDQEAEMYRDGSAIDNTWKDTYIITVPDDTVFDRVGEDGVYVSSGQYCSIQLPPEMWEVIGFSDYADDLSSSWGYVSMRGYRDEENPYRMVHAQLPKTKLEYENQWKENQLGDASLIPEVVDYTYEEKDGCIITRSERRGQSTEESGTGISGYRLDLALLAPDYYYSVTITLKNETPETVSQARAALDSFRILDISTGICRRMEEQIFRGYYGKNTVMTSCLVLLDRDMSEEEIGQCLEKVKNIDKGFLGARAGEALAVRSEKSGWLGIDSPSLQGNCYEKNARKVAKIFQADVILYDEFDGDLLMVAYCSKDRKKSCQRATSFNQEVLEQEFRCYGKEQEFPEELLRYMDLTKEEAAAIWEDEEAIFQMDKWIELAGHMTNPPVPREFIGMWDLRSFQDGFEVIRR